MKKTRYTEGPPAVHGRDRLAHGLGDPLQRCVVDRRGGSATARVAAAR
jgi:hypothetical protein